VALKVFIIRLSAIGDVVHTLPVASAIKDLVPGAHITWVVDEAASDLVLNNPAIDRVIVFPGKAAVSKLLAFTFGSADLQRINFFLKQLRAEKYDVAIDAQGLLKSALLTYISGAKIRIGFAETREFADRFLTHPVKVGDYFGNQRSIVELNLELVKKLQEVTGLGPVGKIQAPKFVLPALSAAAKSKAEEWIDQLFNLTTAKEGPAQINRASRPALLRGATASLPASGAPGVAPGAVAGLETPLVPEAGTAPGVPLVPEAGTAPGAPLVPETETAPGAPLVPETGTAPGAPLVPEAGAAPGMPSVPGAARMVSSKEEFLPNAKRAGKVGGDSAYGALVQPEHPNDQ
jgi:Glycosyltransferase family 9 (heptosyltransferase)